MDTRIIFFITGKFKIVRYTSRDNQPKEGFKRIVHTTKGLQFDGIQSLNKKADLAKLQSWNLIKPVVLIMCKENASKLRLIDTRDDLYNKDLKDVKCKKCGRLLKDELLKDVYQLSDLGKEMTRASHWMTVLVTDTLISNGIPLDCIIWNLSEASEEVDCMIQFHDKVWIFEFKDRNFEAGDAYALYYRGVKFKANRTIILTTGKVSVEARKIFEDLSRTSSTSAGAPFYIEGISNLEEEIGLIIKNETLLYLSEKAREISHLASMDFSPVFLKIFGEYHAETRSGRKERINIFRSRLSF